MPTVLAILADEFEEIEAITPIDLLRRAGATVTVAALGEGIHVTGRSGITLHAETLLAAVEAQSFDCIVLPGGPGTAKLRADPRLRALLLRQHDRGGWIAAICAAPTILADAGLLNGRRYTAHFSTAKELPHILVDQPVVEEDNILTSQGAGTALAFSLSLIARLFSEDKAAEVAHSVCVMP